jgi:hypothetical protein
MHATDALSLTIAEDFENRENDLKFGLTVLRKPFEQPACHAGTFY